VASLLRAASALTWSPWTSPSQPSALCLEVTQVATDRLDRLTCAVEDLEGHRAGRLHDTAPLRGRVAPVTISDSWPEAASRPLVRDLHSRAVGPFAQR
jgi:hypothetical protein